MGLTKGQAVAVAVSVGLILFLIDQATQRWADSALPRAYPFDTCHPDSCIQLLGSLLVLKRSISLPLELPGSSLVSVAFGAVPILAGIAVIMSGGIRYPIHSIAVGLVMGAATSSAYSYLRYGEVEKFIAVAYGGRPYTYFDFGIAALVVGGFVFLAGIATGSVRFSRRRRGPRSRRE
jgi:hypothetical protein